MPVCPVIPRTLGRAAVLVAAFFSAAEVFADSQAADPFSR